MNLYSKEKEIIIDLDRPTIDTGCNADIYKRGHFVIKVYKPNVMALCRITPVMFDLLKDVNNKHFIKLIERYSKTKSTVDSEVDAYKAKFYQKDNTNILYEPKEFLLDNFHEIEKLVNKFTDNSIGICDVNIQNAIINSQGIVLIDPDMYYKSNMTKDKLATENKQELAGFFESICLDGLDYHERNSSIDKKVKRDINNINKKENPEVTQEIAKILRKVKRPIDYLKK